MALLEHSLLDDSPRYSIVLLDLAMPQQDGLDLARTIRSRPEWAGLRLLMLTSVTAVDRARYAWVFAQSAVATDATAGWLVALAACTLFVAYLGAVARLEQARRERREKVRYLPAIEAPTQRVEPPAAARDSVARPG